MAFPTKTTQQTLEAALEQAQALALKIKNQAASWSATLAAVSMRGNVIVQRMERVTGLRDEMNAIIAIPGLGAYANTELGTTDAAADFVAIRDQLNAVLAWVGSNMPKTNGNFVDIIEVSPVGVISYRTFTPAQTAGLRTELDVFATLID